MKTQQLFTTKRGKGEETYNQWTIYNMVSNNRQSVAVLVVEVAREGEMIKIIEHKEVEREVMKCLSIFLLIYGSTTIESNYTTHGYLT